MSSLDRRIEGRHITNISPSAAPAKARAFGHAAKKRDRA